MRLLYICGKGGIRTLGAVSRTLDFESSPFNRSGTFPFALNITRSDSSGTEQCM